MWRSWINFLRTFFYDPHCVCWGLTSSVLVLKILEYFKRNDCALVSLPKLTLTLSPKLFVLFAGWLPGYPAEIPAFFGCGHTKHLEALSSKQDKVTSYGVKWCYGVVRTGGLKHKPFCKARMQSFDWYKVWCQSNGNVLFVRWRTAVCSLGFCRSQAAFW